MIKSLFKKGQVIKTEYPFHIVAKKGEKIKSDKLCLPSIMLVRELNEWNVGFFKDFKQDGDYGISTYYFYDAMGEQEIVILSIAKMPKRYKDRIIFSVRFRWPFEAKEDYFAGWTTKKICVATEHQLKKRLPQFNFGVAEYDKRC